MTRVRPGRYPPVEPFDQGMLDVGDGHQLYWECVGRADGIPAVWLHGGPGSGASVGTRRSFDPSAYRAVIFDQRGTGRSRPLASDQMGGADLTSNTTTHLIADIERLREHLGIESWVVAGGSWGVTLALAYAQAYPQRVTAMVLAAVTSGTRTEISWLTRDVGRVFPREWDDFIALVPQVREHGNIPAAYAELLAAPDPGVAQRAAQAWCTWEDTHVSLTPGWTPSPRYADPRFALQLARLVTHYWGNDCFLAPGQLLDGMSLIGHIPAVLIHGRWDVSSPLQTAWRLHQRWPASRLVVLEDTGHSGAGMTEAIAQALDELRPLSWATNTG